MVWRGHASRASSRSTSPFRRPRVALLCLCIFIQQGPLEVARSLPCPLVHQREAQRCRPLPAPGAQSKQVGQRAAGVHGFGEAPSDGAWQRQGIGRTQSIQGLPTSHPSPEGDSETLTALKTKLEALQAQMTSLQGVAGSDAMVLLLKDFATTLDDRVAELAPTPNATSPHAQSQTLQWKIARKTTQVQGG